MQSSPLLSLSFLQFCLLHFFLAAPSVKADQFNIVYYYNPTCSAEPRINRGCFGIPSLQCCQLPSSPFGLQATKVTSAGHPGIVCHHEPALIGGCGGLNHTGPINTCEVLSPVKPATVLGILDINNAQDMGDTSYSQIGSIDMGDVLPTFGSFSSRDVSNTNSLPAASSCMKNNIVSFNNSRTVWHMREDHHNAEFDYDMEHHSEAYMVEKYSLEIHPATYDPTFFGEEWDVVKELPVFGQDRVEKASASSAAPAASARQKSRTSRQQSPSPSSASRERISAASEEMKASRIQENIESSGQEGQSTMLTRVGSRTSSESAV